MTDRREPTDDTSSALFATLASEPRREIVDHLVRTHSGTSTVDDIVAHIVEQISADNADDVCERARIRLYHVDLPALADAGVIDYDWRSGDVSLTVDVESTAAFLERLKAAEWKSNDRYGSPAQ